MNDYFAPRVTETDSGCWEWQLYRDGRGYGRAYMRALYRLPVSAHRLSYELHVGPIPDGLTVDHMCFNPPCVRPDHLRLMTRSANSAHQLDSYKTHCKRGHELTLENTRIKTGNNGKRDCKTCHRDRERVARTRRLQGVARRGLARGERSGMAVLTDQVVLESRARHACGENVSALAREYGVNRATLREAVLGISWAHLPMRPKDVAA